MSKQQSHSRRRTMRCEGKHLTHPEHRDKGPTSSSTITQPAGGRLLQLRLWPSSGWDLWVHTITCCCDKPPGDHICTGTLVAANAWHLPATPLWAQTPSPAARLPLPSRSLPTLETYTSKNVNIRPISELLLFPPPPAQLCSAPCCLSLYTGLLCTVFHRHLSVCYL